MERDKVILKDGFNGDFVICFREPLAIEGDLVKLQVAEVGKQYMIRWAHSSELAR